MGRAFALGCALVATALGGEFLIGGGEGNAGRGVPAAAKYDTGWG